MRSPTLTEPHLRWLAFAVNTTLLYLLAPLAFWGAFCISSARLDPGVILAALFGFAGTYLVFGVSLLLACVGATAAVSACGHLSRGWQRILLRILVGVAGGVLMGGYVVVRIARDAAAISAPHRSWDSDLFILSCAAGALLGVALPGLWSLSCCFARTVWGAEPGASPNGGPAAAPVDSTATGGPPSVS
jgi:hypothetical protein